ncbi:MAG: DUF2318 domain-containing protein [Desulfovibrio sp.]|jgi:uncharacterized membrane protein|nr:DUF2318 domain-containing protein [Desulfovibrio sp.]
MLHFLVLVTGALFMAVLVFCLLQGYGAARELFEIRPWLRAGSILGVVIAAVLSLLEFTTGWVVREYYNLAAQFALILSEICLLFFILSTRALSPEKAASPLYRFAFFVFAAAWGAFYLPDVFIYPSHFAVGVVNVVSSEFVFIVIGYCAGLALSLLAGYAVLRVASSLPASVLTPLLFVALAAFSVSQAVTVVQTLLGRGLVPRTDTALNIVIFLLNNSAAFLYSTTGISCLMAVILLWRSAKAKEEEGNPARRRKARSRMRSRMRWSGAALAMLCSGLLVLTVGMRFNVEEIELAPPVSMTATNGMIHIPLALVGDGRLHRFAYASRKGVEVRYIVIKKSETAYGVGLDACDVCGPSGYFERKGQVVCILCDVVMNKATIGFAGGCNPVPVKFAVRDGNIVIDTAVLEAEALRFM